MPIQADGAIVPQILRTLRDAVIRIDLPPDVLLSETKVARCFGVSRQPVREVFIKLQKAGLLSIHPSAAPWCGASPSQPSSMPASSRRR